MKEKIKFTAIAAFSLLTLSGIPTSSNSQTNKKITKLKFEHNKKAFKKAIKETNFEENASLLSPDQMALVEYLSTDTMARNALAEELVLMNKIALKKELEIGDIVYFISQDSIMKNIAEPNPHSPMNKEAYSAILTDENKDIIISEIAKSVLNGSAAPVKDIYYTSVILNKAIKGQETLKIIKESKKLTDSKISDYETTQKQLDIAKIHGLSK